MIDPLSHCVSQNNSILNSSTKGRYVYDKANLALVSKKMIVGRNFVNYLLIWLMNIKYIIVNTVKCRREKCSK